MQIRDFSGCGPSFGTPHARRSRPTRLPQRQPRPRALPQRPRTSRRATSHPDRGPQDRAPLLPHPHQRPRPRLSTPQPREHRPHRTDKACGELPVVPAADDTRRRPLRNEPPREPRSDLLRRHHARRYRAGPPRSPVKAAHQTTTPNSRHPHRPPSYRDNLAPSRAGSSPRRCSTSRSAKPATTLAASP